jgi:molybdopterin synthase sulfur carrier subunit
MIRINLPVHLRTLVKENREILLHGSELRTLGSVLDALEEQYPMLQGTIRDHGTKKCRPFIRFFLCGEDWTHETMDVILPEAVLLGAEPLRIVGAIAGG